jgi:hypothetical protein
MLWGQWTGHLKELITVDGLFRHHRRIQRIHFNDATTTIPAADLRDNRQTSLVMRLGSFHDISINVFSAWFNHDVLLDAAQLCRPKIDLVDADSSNVLNPICVATEDARLVVL